MTCIGQKSPGIQRSLLLSLEAVVIFMGFGLAAWADSGFENFYVAVPKLFLHSCIVVVADLQKRQIHLYLS